MAAPTIQTIIARAMAEADFRELLFTNPDQALSGYELSEAEINNLKNLPRVEFDRALNGSPEERISFQLNPN